MDINKSIENIKQYINDSRKGLPEELFLFATEITPMSNVDLLVRDKQGQVLLSWRDDSFYGQGWHVPGGIIRLQETFAQRIKRTAENEIGCFNMQYNETPLEIVQIICPEMKERSHFISLVYDCRLPEGFVINNHDLVEHDAGYLKWFKSFPDDMLKVHEFYKKYFCEGDC